ILLFDIQRVGPQGVLHTALGVVHPLLNLGRREVVGSTGLGNCRLALNDVNDQGAFALGRPAFDVFVHLQTHGDFLDYHLSRFSLGHYSSTLARLMLPTALSSDCGSSLTTLIS